MRIMIEINPEGEVKTSVTKNSLTGNHSAKFPEIETIDAGTPPEMLLRSMAEVMPVPDRESDSPQPGVNAGTPPEWLIKAIQSAAFSKLEDSASISNGGAAPIQN